MRKTTTHLYINRQGDALTMKRKPSFKDSLEYRRVPQTIGIIWDTVDQSQNMITLDLRYRHDYEFDPLEDWAMFEDYVDLIAEALFS